ncbi:hypothetical protein [Amycolatopsis samaneae]|uniref:Uncharacterized protein n=1 Tax=Amycolatopsis samaneae TaxID=664691 RepID=A0ABW5GE89_9PSEU
MFAMWVQIAELLLLPLGLGAGYLAGRVSGHDERASLRADTTGAHPGLAPEYPSYPEFPLNLSYPAAPTGWRARRHLHLGQGPG